MGSVTSGFSIQATVMQTPTRTNLEVLERATISVDGDGIITAINDPLAHPTVALGTDVVLLPGLIDTHMHAPQWPQLGTGLDLPLEDWLFEHTFPLEKRLTDPAFAALVWPQMVNTLLAHGTTTAAYFATIDVATTTMLAETCAELGQRALVGRVAMDHPEGTPEWYRDVDSTTAIADSHASIVAIEQIKSPLVSPILTPRFAPACTDDTLAALGELASSTGVALQTHCSESDWQHHYAWDRFGTSDTTALAQFGLIQPHTVLAHGDHLGSDDLQLIKNAGAGVAHCPLSNAYFANAVFPARRALDAGVRVGLGSDVAGGAEPGLLAQCAHAVTASRYLEDGVDPAADPSQRGVSQSRLSVLDAFYMATSGGAELLNVNAGVLAVGKSFDALAVRLNREGSPLQMWDELDSPERIFEKIVRLAAPADICDVWVAGARVAGSS